MVRTMLEELRLSSEPKYLVEAAMKYLRGLKGHLVRDKRMIRERAAGGGSNGTAPATVSMMIPSGQFGAPSGQQVASSQNLAAVANGMPTHGDAAFQQMSLEDRVQALASFQPS